MPRTAPEWRFKKGGERWRLAEQIWLSPPPKTGGWAGEQLRLLSVSRGQSVITDLEQGSLAINRRRTGLPSMHQMWFQHRGYSQGYSQHRSSADPPELFFFDPEARLCAKQRLPAAVADASAGTEQWFVACRDGRAYAFSFDGAPQWNQLVPCARRDKATNAMWGLPIFHPRLHLAAHGPALAIAGEQQLHRYESSGERRWSGTLPRLPKSGLGVEPAELPTREDRLARLGLLGTADRQQIRTGYLRLALDTNWNAGWLKQLQISDIEGVNEEAACAIKFTVEIELPKFDPGVTAIRASWRVIVTGTQDGLVHVFDWEGTLKQTFQVGDSAVSDALVTADGLRAAYSAGHLTLFEDGRIGPSTQLPEYFAELTDCGRGVLACSGKSVWLVESTGRVALAAESDRPIRGLWGHSSGFYALAGDLSSFQVRSSAARCRETG